MFVSLKEPNLCLNKDKYFEHTTLDQQMHSYYTFVYLQ
jgi:hypothetical protein